MNSYPTLLRRLGLVVDFVLDPRRSPRAPTCRRRRRSRSRRGLTIARTKDVSPLDAHAVLGHDSLRRCRTRRCPPLKIRVTDGLVEITPQRFDLLQADVDGAGLKLMNFVRTLARLRPDDQRIDPVTRFEKDLGAPALRTAGLMLVQRERSAMLKGRFAANTVKNTAADKVFQNQSGAKPPDLWAEDLVRGFRVDIWDRKTGVWRSLCERDATYDLERRGRRRHAGAARRRHGPPRCDEVARSGDESNSRLPARSARVVDRLESRRAAARSRDPSGRLGGQDDGLDRRRGAAGREAQEPIQGQIRVAAAAALRPPLLDPRAGPSTSPATRCRHPSPASARKARRPSERAVPALRTARGPVLALVQPAGAMTTPLPIEGRVDGPDRDSHLQRRRATPCRTRRTRWRAAVPPQVSIREAEQHGRLDAAASSIRRPSPAREREGPDASDPSAALANRKDRR